MKSVKQALQKPFFCVNTSTIQFNMAGGSMGKKTDMQSFEDIILLVDTFYGKVQTDDLIGLIFNARLEGKWPEHLQRMHRFWQSILLEQNTYSGRPFPPHAALGISQEHFNRWLLLFGETVDHLFDGPKATTAKSRAEKMSELFVSKLNYLRDHPGKSLL